MKKHATVIVNAGYILPRLETICFHLDMAQAGIEKLNRHVEHINQETVDQLNDIASEIKSRCNRFATYLRKQEPFIAEIEADHFRGLTKKANTHLERTTMKSENHQQQTPRILPLRKQRLRNERRLA